MSGTPEQGLKSKDIIPILMLVGYVLANLWGKWPFISTEVQPLFRGLQVVCRTSDERAAKSLGYAIHLQHAETVRVSGGSQNP